MIQLHELRTELRDRLYDLQDGHCGMCGESDVTLCLDHDHATGMIRGLLCRGCNLREGQHRECAAFHWCEVCIWRSSPAVTWIGWTVLDVVGPDCWVGQRRPRFTASAVRARDNETSAHRASAVLGARLDGVA